MSNEITTPYDRVLIDPNEPLILPDGTAITGRLETFLYALCCLDYDNLPTPLSRIEEFANALITGEIPNIEPQSRSEQFFLAILDGNIDNLPEPQSRSEVLLNKLAVGDFDLTNVDPIQSRYELLLAYLIKNGGVGNLDYVLYEFYQATQTLYNTQEKPVKSAILKGNTLVNHINQMYEIQCEAGGYERFTIMRGKMLPAGTYILLYNVVKTGGEATELRDRSTPYYTKVDGTIIYQGWENFNLTTGKKYWIFTSDQAIENLTYWCAYRLEEVHVKDFVLLTYQEGMENRDIPFFEGMQSVKMPVLTTTGKNLIDINTLPIMDTKNCEVIDGIVYKKPTAEHEATRWVMPVKPNTTYTISAKGSTGTVQISNFLQSTSPEFDSRILLSQGDSSVTFTTSSHTELTLYIFNSEVANFEVSDIQLEYGTQATPYEPYNSNILTTSEEVELRGVGNLKDELDLITGELTQRIGEITLDGSDDEKWVLGTTKEKTQVFEFSSDSLEFDYKLPLDSFTNKTISDKFIHTNQTTIDDMEKYAIGNKSSTPTIWVALNKTTASTVVEFETYLKSNPITIQYPLKNESVKTVDLSVIDQDGNVLPKIKTFNNITHVNVSSDGILPKVEMEVATYNDEDIANANVMTASMDEIYSVQNELDNTNSIQSEEIDSTMIASTEIYENIL